MASNDPEMIQRFTKLPNRIFTGREFAVEPRATQAALCMPRCACDSFLFRLDPPPMTSGPEGARTALSASSLTGVPADMDVRAPMRGSWKVGCLKISQSMVLYQHPAS